MMTTMFLDISSAQLIADLRDARARTLAMVEDLSGDQLMGPVVDTINPVLWEIGHVAWFYEHWILRHLDGRDPIMAEVDRFYDSSNVPHDDRWTLPLPDFDAVRDYMHRVLDILIARLEGREPTPEERYFYQLALYHEDMHAEALTYTRQTLQYPTPSFPTAHDAAPAEAGPLRGDVEVPGGWMVLGACGSDGFIFDNEKWAHPVYVAPFRMARGLVTHEDFAAFVEDEGYTRRAFWDDEGWTWRQAEGLTAPRYWRRVEGGWEVRHFDQWRPLPAHEPISFVSWHEARAYCRWAGRRLPTEAEWEMAAACVPESSGTGVQAGKRRYPWGEEAPTPRRANLDGWRIGAAEAAAHPEGESAFGCRQMMGAVWEWTESLFAPYPGFSPDPYKDYSEPWFGTHRVLRGGCWATRQRMMRNTLRNYFTPGRNDVLAGFRTCGVEP